MLAYGLRSVSMDDIAGALGSSKKTLYNHFEDKDTLVLDVFGNIFNENRENCLKDRQRAENAIEEIFFAMQMMKETLQNINPAVHFDLEKYHPKAFTLLREYKQNFLYGIIKDNLVRGQKEKLYRKELNIEIITRLRVESNFLFFNETFRNVQGIDYNTYQREVFTHFLYGVVTPRGYEMVEHYLKKYQTK